MAGRRATVVTTVLLALSGLALSAQTGGDEIVGLWLTGASDEGRARVRIERIGELYEGTITWLEIPVYPPDDDRGMAGQPKIDRENPDPALRRRPVNGLLIMRGFRYAGDRRWESGELYDPETGNTYRSKMRLDADGTLRVRGYIGISLIGRTTEWTRVEPVGESP